MQAIKKKLRSQRGASLTFALLIFLVCAVVGSVVLAAGTASSGRMSQIAEMDQRYYSVNSAARLLTELIDGKSVTIVRTEQEGLSPTYQNENGIAINDYNFDSIARHAAYCIATEKNASYTLQMKVNDNEDLNVQISEKITISPEKLILTVQNEDNANAYAMKLTFSPDVNKVVEEIPIIEEDTDADAEGDAEADEDTEEEPQEVSTVTTWTITWNFQSNEILGSKRWK